MRAPPAANRLPATSAISHAANTATGRRQFLKRLGSGAAGMAALPLLPDELLARSAMDMLRPRTGAQQDESYWKVVRSQFPLRANVRPMNAANLCPAPRIVIDRVNAVGLDVDGDVSFQNRAQYDALRERVRERLAAYLGVSADEVAIVRNTSEANNIIAGGVQLGAGDEVLLHSENHASNSVSWDVRASRYGFTLKRVAVTPQMTPDEMLATFRAALTPRTRVLSFTDISNTTGIRLPAQALCALARERNVHAHVDGAQSFGAVRLNLETIGCDSYATSAHKWFMGPKEAGVLYVRAERAPSIWPGVVSVGYNATTPPAGARRFEALGQRNDATIAGLDAALDFRESIGPAVIEARVLTLAAALKDRIAAIPGTSLVTPQSPVTSAGVVIARFPGDMRAMYEKLYTEHGVAGAATGGLRLCPHIYNTMEDIVHTGDALRRLSQGQSEGRDLV